MQIEKGKSGRVKTSGESFNCEGSKLEWASIANFHAKSLSQNLWMSDERARFRAGSADVH